MSRWIEKKPGGRWNVTIDNPEDCKYMYNETCCNADSEEVGDFPDREFCKERCPHFEKEDFKLDQ